MTMTIGVDYEYAISILTTPSFVLGTYLRHAWYRGGEALCSVRSLGSFTPAPSPDTTEARKLASHKDGGTQ